MTPVTRRDTGIAHHAIPPDPGNRRAIKMRSEGRLIQLQQIGKQRCSTIQCRRNKGWLTSRHHEAREWAHILAYVAAEDPVAHQRSEFACDPALILDGEIADAAAGIERVGRRESVRGASYQAALAASTHGFTMRRVIVIELHVRQKLAQEEITASLRMN